MGTDCSWSPSMATFEENTKPAVEIQAPPSLPAIVSQTDQPTGPSVATFQENTKPAVDIQREPIQEIISPAARLLADESKLDQPAGPSTAIINENNKPRFAKRGDNLDWMREVSDDKPIQNASLTSTPPLSRIIWTMRAFEEDSLPEDVTEARLKLARQYYQIDPRAIYLKREHISCYEGHLA
ncbi:hypothetical protein JMJ35_001549 [Cladonia borealis]|uniref:Uncharacterized protein n=1 Tax=Cladonia borealis TaxID=184061 RepID=A0AA39R629_9LECA|nr:hypothetical protein JMJ35_001549 [Cladonia borealis]